MSTEQITTKLTKAELVALAKSKFGIDINPTKNSRESILDTLIKTDGGVKVIEEASKAHDAKKAAEKLKRKQEKLAKTKANKASKKEKSAENKDDKEKVKRKRTYLTAKEKNDIWNKQSGHPVESIKCQEPNCNNLVNPQDMKVKFLVKDDVNSSLIVCLGCSKKKKSTTSRRSSKNKVDKQNIITKISTNNNNNEMSTASKKELDISAEKTPDLTEIDLEKIITTNDDDKYPEEKVVMSLPPQQQLQKASNLPSVSTKKILGDIDLSLDEDEEDKKYNSESDKDSNVADENENDDIDEDDVDDED